MSKGRTYWGVIARVEAVHVVPCTDDGTVLAGHTTIAPCDCGPRIDATSGRKLVLIHHDGH